MLEKLSCSLGRNDEEPNIELANLLCENNDRKGIEEIVSGLKGTDKAIANDCIKVLYEIGNRKPELVSDYTADFISLLLSKNNRLAWGSMMALATVTELHAKEVYSKLDIIKKAYEVGSVITIDHSITVLAKLCKADKKYEKELFPILLEHLTTCRPKEVPQHAERTMLCINDVTAKRFIEVLKKRKQHLMDSQIKRIDKIIKRVISHEVL